ncbi:MAG: hypothetical protein J0652_02695 [Desulfobulbaceae bacterium]|nr:hypothetical protein [Desulfobulbaceae bacterium]
MRILFFHENPSLTGKIRRATRRVTAWVKADGLPCATVFFLMGGMIIMTLITIGEHPSGPAAKLSSSPYTISSDSTSIQTPGHDPCTIASRVDHGQLMGSIER